MQKCICVCLFHHLQVDTQVYLLVSVCVCVCELIVQWYFETVVPPAPTWLGMTSAAHWSTWCQWLRSK